MKKIIIGMLILSSLVLADKDSIITGMLTEKDISNKFVPFIKGTYETEELWIDIIPLCSEGNINCNDVIYIGVNKNNGFYIILKGSGFLDGNGNFGGYTFSNNEYNYTIHRNDYLYISKNNKILKEIKLNKRSETE